MGDDGAGAAALAALEAGWELPVEVERLDLGTPGPYLAELLRGFEAILVFDTIKAAAPPGEVRLIAIDPHKPPPSVQRFTPHTPDLGEALATLAFEDMAPTDVELIGVVPDVVDAGTELSERVQKAVPLMASLAAAELETLGFTIRRRDVAPMPTLWWERAEETLI